MLATGSQEKSIKLWDVMTGKQKSELNVYIDSVSSICFSPDGNTLASCGRMDQSIFLWDVRKEEVKTYLYEYGDFVDIVCFSPDGSMLASGYSDGTICLFDMSSKISLQNQKDILIIKVSLVICFSPNGKMLASGGWHKITDMRYLQQISSQL